MWDLPGPGIEPVSPELGGGFLTTAPLGKPHSLFFFKKQNFTVTVMVIIIIITGTTIAANFFFEPEVPTIYHLN